MLKSSYDYDRANKIIAQGKSNSQLFIHKELGYNYGMTNINASIGLGQLKNITNIKCSLVLTITNLSTLLK